MGNTISYYTGLEMPRVGDQLLWQNDQLYAIFDPTQNSKPEGRTKDIISFANRDNPNRLDRVAHLGCDTVWKCFKRNVWRLPDRPFLGERRYESRGHLDKYNIQSQKRTLGGYAWQTWSETDEIVEAFSRAIIKKKLCPVVTSDVIGTPDLKMMGIFSENKLEWIMTELACCSDSVTIVPIAIESQFLQEARITHILDST